MIIKLMSTIAVFIYTVHTVPQFGLVGGILRTVTNVTSINPSELLNITSGVGKMGEVASGVVKVAVDSAQRIAESLKGLIENFTDFKAIFNKTYTSVAEETLRKQIFKSNLAFINDHNELFKKGKETFSLAINSLGDLTRDEYLKLLSYNLSKAPNAISNDTTSKNTRQHRRHSRAIGCQFPEEKDWRKNGAVTPVKDQLTTCGSCWAFAVTGAFESHYFLKYGELHDFSEQQLVDCAESEGKGCSGVFMFVAYLYAMTNGIVNSEKYPYKGRESGVQNKCKNLRSDFKITYFQAIDQNEAALKDAVCRFGPIAVVIDARSETFQFHHGGIYRGECSTKRIDGNHAVLIVGYGTDSDTNEPYWIVKNSYGTSWSENGYIRILRDPNRSCGIEKMASFPGF